MAKSPTDFATDVDLAAERAIVGVLCAARPTDRVEGEELGTLGLESAHRTWLVDPLCGTLNFAAHTPQFAVNVALLAGEEAAASADPLANEVFWTDGRHGYVRRGGTDEGLVPSSSSRLIEVNLDPPYPTAVTSAPFGCWPTGPILPLRCQATGAVRALADDVRPARRVSDMGGGGPSYAAGTIDS